MWILASRNADGADARSSRFQKDASALVERGPGGQDVIDEDEVFVLHECILTHSEGFVQVFHAFGAVKGGLRLRAAGAFQGGEQREMELG